MRTRTFGAATVAIIDTSTESALDGMPVTVAVEPDNVTVPLPTIDMLLPGEPGGPGVPGGPGGPCGPPAGPGGPGGPGAGVALMITPDAPELANVMELPA